MPKTTTTALTVVPEAPVLHVRDGAVFANSRDVADYFGKNHRDVMRAIDMLIEQEPGMGLRNFAQTPYADPQNGQTYRSFDMDRRGFTILSMGFTGKKALQWKLRYIDAFEAMEAEIDRAAKVQLPDFSDPVAAARAWADERETRQAVAAQIEKLKPMADVALHATAARRSLHRVGKMFEGVNVNALPGALEKLGYFFKRSTGYQVRHQYRDTLFAERMDSTHGTATIIVLPAGYAELTKLYREGRLVMKKAFSGFNPAAAHVPDFL